MATRNSDQELASVGIGSQPGCNKSEVWFHFPRARHVKLSPSLSFGKITWTFGSLNGLRLNEILISPEYFATPREFPDSKGLLEIVSPFDIRAAIARYNSLLPKIPKMIVPEATEVLPSKPKDTTMQSIGSWNKLREFVDQFNIPMTYESRSFGAVIEAQKLEMLQPVAAAYSAQYGDIVTLGTGQIPGTDLTCGRIVIEFINK